MKMEEDVFEAVIRWYKYDREERIKYKVSNVTVIFRARIQLIFQ